MITNEQLTEFCAAVLAKLVAACSSDTFVTFQRGQKYARIVTNNSGNLQHGSAFCFVALDTGAILKSDGWKRPAPQNRGNIANGAADVTAYGAQYIR